MRLKPEQLTQHLQKQSAPLYTIFGHEPLLIIEASDCIRSHARQQGYTEREIFTIDHRFNWVDLLSAGNNMSLFGDRKIMDIRIPSGKPGREGGKAIETYCQNLPSDTITLINLPKLDRQSQSTKWFKALEDFGVVIPVYAVERAQLPAWVGQRLSMQQQKADSETLQFFADKVEGNLLAAHQEIKKLALLYPDGYLSFEQVKDAVLNVARYDVFKLSDAMVTANVVRYNRILNGLQGEGSPPPLILATLAEQIRQLIIIRKGLDGGMAPAQLMKEARLWGDRQKTMTAAAKRIDLKSLMQGLLHAAKIDRVIKGVAKGDIWEELLQLGLRFSK
ncbi:MAG: DNA polymerase III subunit delta [Betaproteobacteria bacterium]|nr:DNA polymerase III subunit delta [Betaproteobacteria bacterium]